MRENLLATAANRGYGSETWTLRSVLGLFPALAERLSSAGGLLSGGEQQMLAIGRALMTNPRLLILDEATEGLAPIVRRTIWGAIAQLKTRGQALLLIDKNVEALTHIADRHAILEKGVVVWSGSSEELRNATNVTHRYLGL